MISNGIKRNNLDYIITDLMPVELPEMFSYLPFYNYLVEKKTKVISDVLLEIQRLKGAGDKLLFKKGWSTCPLKYGILKTECTIREMSLMQPLSLLNVFFFIECYQKDILDYIKANNVFSVRYHVKNTELYYKGTKKAISEYQSLIKKNDILLIQQTGNFFKIRPCESVNELTSLKRWQTANFKYNNWAKIDYKSCFDSVYSHAMSWIIEKNSYDAIKANNSNLFVIIDRLLQNINNHYSNGILVGPEFSRMIVELLLETIDIEVRSELKSKNKEHEEDYEIFRYVDDIFIFSKDEKTIDSIISLYDQISRKYRLQLNEAKKEKAHTPYMPKEWLEDCRTVSDMISGIFNNKETSNSGISVSRIKDNILVLINRFPNKRGTIVSFILSSFINRINSKKSLSDVKFNKALAVLDLILFAYAFFPSFEQTRKVISLVCLIDMQFQIKSDSIKTEKLYRVLSPYFFIFENTNLIDICDWLPLFSEFGMHLNVSLENKLLERIESLNNPLIWAVFVHYSKYNKFFFDDVTAKLNEIIAETTSLQANNSIFEKKDFWFILTFCGCPYISQSNKTALKKIISDINTIANSSNQASDICKVIICDYLLEVINGQCEGLIRWKDGNLFGKIITFRTTHRTIFRKRHNLFYGLDVSV